MLAFTLPRLFPPPEDVDIAPAAGLVFLIVAGISFLLAVALLAHSVKRRSNYTMAERTLAMAPFVVTVAALIVGAVRVLGVFD